MKIADLFESPLDIHPEMYRQSAGNKDNIIVEMSAEKFLELTTQEIGIFTSDYYRKTAQSLDKYNEYIKTGQNILMPFLRIDLTKKKIMGHEGRHRCAALLNAGESLVTVSLRLIPSKKEIDKYGIFKAEYECKFEDLPNIIASQYSSAIFINKKEFTVKIDGLENIRNKYYG